MKWFVLAVMLTWGCSSDTRDVTDEIKDGDWVTVGPSCSGIDLSTPACTDEQAETEEKWKSAQYYGFGQVDNDGCYRIGGVVNDCWFPTSKQVRLVEAYSSCYDHTSVPILEVQAMIDGAHNAVNNLINTQLAGTGVSFVTSGGQQLTVGCLAVGDSARGRGGLEGSATTQISNLPAAPNGQDEVKARQVNGSGARISPSTLKSSCPGLTTAGLKTRAGQDMVHEVLHGLGFDHSGQNGSLMFPSSGCDVIGGGTFAPLPIAFWNALKDYSGSTGSVSIVSDGLPTPTDD